MTDLLAFCATLQLDFYKALAFILKGEWERFLALNNRAALYFGDDMPTGNNGDYAALAKSFRPNTQQMLSAFQTQGQWKNPALTSQGRFDALIREMILAQLHLAANSSPEIKAFTARLLAQTDMIGDSSPETEQAFWEAKLNWLWLQEELGDKLLLLESRRLKNARIHKEWMKHFGKAYIQLKEQSLRYELLQLKVKLIEADPSLSISALQHMAQDIAEAMQKELDGLQLALSMAHYWQQGKSGPVADNSTLDQYLGKCKKALRQIWLLIHPDRLSQHPSYGKLTSDQKHQIKELWHRALRIRPEELDYVEGQIGYEYRSDLVLRDILHKAQAILRHAGIDTDTDLIVSGDSLEEQLASLERANLQLSREINNATAELKALIEDPAVLEKTAILNADPEQQERIRDEFYHRADDFRRKADALEWKLEALSDNGKKPDEKNHQKL